MVEFSSIRLTPLQSSWIGLSKRQSGGVVWVSCESVNFSILEAFLPH
jgi:hypothetical protein